MKILRSGLKNIFILLLMLAGLNPKPCGVVNIFEADIELNQKGFIIAEEEVTQNQNGKKFSLFGWMNLTDEKKTSHPLIRIDFLSQDETQPFKDFFKLSYEDLNPESALVVEIYDDDKKIIKRENTVLLKNVWMFIGISFDYEMGIFSLYIEGSAPSKYEFSKDWQVNGKGFQIPKKFNIEIGCFTESQKSIEENLLTCLIGRTRNFSYFFDYLKDLKLAKFIDVRNNSNEFVFDFYQNNESNFFSSKDNQKLNLDLSQEKSFLEKEKFIFFKDKNFAILKKKELFNLVKYIDSPSFYFVFEYEEDLENQFFLLNLKDVKNSSQLEIVLNKTEKGRNLEINLPGLKNIFKSLFTFEAKKVYKTIISLVRENQNFYVILKNEENIEFSEINIFPNFENGDIEILKNNDKTYNGNFTLYQFNILENVSGPILDYLQQKNGKIDIECESGCLNFSIIQNEKKKCIECKKEKVLDFSNNSCEDFCSFGFKNIQNRCFKCYDENCSELTQNDLVLEQSGPSQFRLVANEQINITKDYFDLKIDNASHFVDYTFNDTFFPKNNTIIYDFDFKKSLIGSELSFTPKKGSNPPIYNTNTKTVYQKVLAAKIESIKEEKVPEKKEIPTDSVTKEIIPSQPPIGVTLSTSREDYTNNTHDSNFKRLATAAYAFTVIALVIGLIGIFFVCPYLESDANEFYFQKYIQTFLIIQYIIFWLFYDVKLPSCLKSFLARLFQLFVSWHKVFKDVTKNNFDSSANFNQFYFYNEKTNFYEQDVFTHFLTNFSFILLLQGFFLLIYIFFKIINSISVSSQDIKKKPTLEKKTSLSQKIVSHFEFKILITIFLIFTVECVVFIMYNYFQNNYDHPYFKLSLSLAIIFFVLIIFLIAFTLIAPFLFLKKPELGILPNSKFFFIWTGLELTNIKKNFQGIQYLLYFLFSLFIFLPNRIAQIIVNLILLFFFVCYIVGLRPPLQFFWKVEQILIHILLLIAKVLLTVLVIDDSTKKISGKSRYVIGFVLAILLFVIIMWNFIVLLVKLYLRYLACKKAKMTKENLKLKKPQEEEKVFLKNNNRIKEEKIEIEIVESNEKINDEVNLFQPDEDDGIFYDQEIFIKNKELNKDHLIDNSKITNASRDLSRENLKKEILSEFEINNKIQNSDLVNQDNIFDFNKDKKDNILNFNEKIDFDDKKKFEDLFGRKDKETISFGTNNKQIVNTLISGNKDKIIPSKNQDYNIPMGEDDNE